MFHWFVALAMAGPPEDALPVVEGDVLVIRVYNADPDQAPMLHLGFSAGVRSVGCADDGSSPDPVPNDGVFHCTADIPEKEKSQDEWTATLTTRSLTGEDIKLGLFQYSGGPGTRFATVTIGDEAAAHQEPFSLEMSSEIEIVELPVLVPQEVDVVAPSLPPEPVPPEPVPHEAAPPHEGAEGGLSALAPPWLWLLMALGLGWLVGQRKSKPDARQLRVRDGARLVPLSPLGAHGPIPEGEAVVVSSTDPLASLCMVVDQLTDRRRLVVLGGAPIESKGVGHPIYQVTDPDRHAVTALLADMLTDGGLPPILLIAGRHAAIDSGGTSPDPTHDLIDAVCPQTWVAWFLTESEPVPAGLFTWGYDPQAGWSVR
jgi:hypothetical protein